MGSKGKLSGIVVATVATAAAAILVVGLVVLAAAFTSFHLPSLGGNGSGVVFPRVLTETTEDRQLAQLDLPTRVGNGQAPNPRVMDTRLPQFVAILDTLSR